jgi:hypothetical protein
MSPKASTIPIIVACLTLVVACVMISARKYFWHDELYSWYLLADPSFSRMWEAFNDRLNVSPPLYFVVGWIWARLFGASELSLRLFSSVGISAALVVGWLALKRIYPPIPATIGILTVFMTSELVLTQNAEARMYGLYLALVAAAILQYVGAYRAQSREIKYRTCFVIALTHAALINTHIFGAFYSAAVLGAFVVSDLVLRKPQVRIYVAVVSGWLLWLVYLPAYLVQSQVVTPQGWLPKPLLTDMIDLVGPGTPFVNSAFAGAVVIAVIVARLLSRRGILMRALPVGGTSRKWETPMLVLALLLLLPVPVTWVISRTLKPMFWDRYLIPTLFSYAIALTHVCSRYLPSHLIGQVQPDRSFSWHLRGARGAMWLYFGALIIFPVADATAYGKQTRPGHHDAEFGYSDLPIVVQAPGEFLARWQYAPDRRRYYYILDRAAEQGADSGPFGLQAFKHLEAFRRNYPELAANVIASETFLGHFERFLVVDNVEYDRPCATEIMGLEYAREWSEMHCPQWIEKRLLGNPEYSVRKLGVSRAWQSVLLVERHFRPEVQ